jgi:hypothetical protein
MVLKFFGLASVIRGVYGRRSIREKPGKCPLQKLNTSNAKLSHDSIQEAYLMKKLVIIIVSAETG